MMALWQSSHSEECAMYVGSLLLGRSDCRVTYDGLVLLCVR